MWNTAGPKLWMRAPPLCMAFNQMGVCASYHLGAPEERGQMPGAPSWAWLAKLASYRGAVLYFEIIADFIFSWNQNRSMEKDECMRNGNSPIA